MKIFIVQDYNLPRKGWLFVYRHYLMAAAQYFLLSAAFP